jgi:aryl-alcohol dehydrogenase-like predicted oxidoreductase
VVAQLEASLRALATDHLDIYQMHSGSDEVSRTTGIGVEDRTEVRVASMAWSDREVVA